MPPAPARSALMPLKLTGMIWTPLTKPMPKRWRQTDKPVWIIAKTEKGHGVSFLANKEGWHGKALNADQAKDAIAELGGERHIIVPTFKAGRLAARRARRRRSR